MWHGLFNSLHSGFVCKIYACEVSTRCNHRNHMNTTSLLDGNQRIKLNAQLNNFWKNQPPNPKAIKQDLINNFVAIFTHTCKCSKESRQFDSTFFFTAIKYKPKTYDRRIDRDGRSSLPVSELPSSMLNFVSSLSSSAPSSGSPAWSNSTISSCNNKYLNIYIIVWGQNKNTTITSIFLQKLEKINFEHLPWTAYY